MKRLLLFFLLACLSVFGAIAGIVHYPQQSAAEAERSSEKPVALTFYTPPAPESVKTETRVNKKVKKAAAKPVPKPKPEEKRVEKPKPQPLKQVQQAVPKPEEMPAVTQAEEALPVEEETPASAAPTEKPQTPAAVQTPKSAPKQIVEAYYGKLYSRISRQKYYPHQARRFGIEGDVSVVFLIDSEGRIVETKLLKKSGNRLLDRAALEIFRQIEQFEKPPESMAKRSFEITIDYHLS